MGLFDSYLGFQTLGLSSLFGDSGGSEQGRGRGGLPAQTRRLGRATFQGTPGAPETLAHLRGLMEQARNLPEDSGIQQQIVEGIRKQALATQPTAATPAGAGRTGISREAVGAAISGTEALRSSTFLRRFQAQQEVLGVLAQQTRAGFRGGPTEQLVQERAAIRTARMQIDAERNMAFLKMFLSAAGTATTALA